MIENGTTQMIRPHASARTGSETGYDVATLLMLLLGGFVVPVLGWIAAVVMAWNLPRWTVGQKWLATLIWPVALAAPVVALLLSPDGLGTTVAGVPVVLVTIVLAVLAVPAATVHLGLAAARAGRCPVS